MFKFWGKKAAHFDFSQLGADMHSHLVPGIDDGAPDLATSLELIRGLTSLGYKKLITTPHVMADMYNNTTDDILTNFEGLKKAVADEGIEVELGVAAEYFLDDQMKKIVMKKEKLLTITDNIILVEFSLASHPIDLREILFELQLQGYQPLIAHPERYIYPEKGKGFFDELRTSNYLFQLNILSLIGGYGKEVQRQANYILAQQWYEFAGTDLHNFRHLEMLHDPQLTSLMKKVLDSGNIRNQEI